MERGLPTAAADGLTLTPLMATSAPDTVEVIFNTPKPLDNARWQSIVIHDSGSPVGNPASLDAQARANNLRGLGYHFVIGNGNGMDDGQLAVGSRWLNQMPGAHAAGPKADWYNRHSIGICLIGDGNRNRFTPAQMRRLVQLVDALCREFKIPPDKVVLHSQICSTDDPGSLFSEATLRAQLSRNP
jgi:N-acetyl-anhydromuramyl-L-alanine amidase AmpD